MTVTLTPQHEALNRQKVASGLYRTADETIEAAVRLLDEHDRPMRRLRVAIAEGEIGEAIPWTPELVEQLSREVDEMLRRGEQPAPDVCP